MRRALILFLLCLLPFQFAWAMAASYCAHERNPAVQHFGHHDDGCHTTSDSSDGGKQDGKSLDHHCHLPGFLGVPYASAAAAHERAHRMPLDGEGSYPSLPLHPPERPQWLRLA
jgi:hypothetical protein